MMFRLAEIAPIRVEGFVPSLEGLRLLALASDQVAAKKLGEVECRGSHDWDQVGPLACPDCGAAL